METIPLAATEKGAVNEPLVIVTVPLLALSDVIQMDICPVAPDGM
jgi:hypothetical protein